MYKKDWIFSRFSNNIINSTSEAIEKIKDEYKNKQFTMIGYSGGVAIASLISNKREDVKC